MCPIKHHRGRFDKEYQNAESESMLGRDRDIVSTRHVDVLVESLGLESGNTVQTPRVDDVEDENPVQLDPERISKCRSHVARCLFLGQDRADKTFAVNELCQKMSDPSQHSFAKLNPLVRYLKGRRQWIPVFKFGDMSSEVTVFYDSEWAGDKETRNSSSAGVALVGRQLYQNAYKKTENHRQKQRCMQQHWERQKRRVSRA